jgi:hypothetical protein
LGGPLGDGPYRPDGQFDGRVAADQAVGVEPGEEPGHGAGGDVSGAFQVAGHILFEALHAVLLHLLTELKDG